MVSETSLHLKKKKKAERPDWQLRVDSVGAPRQKRSAVGRQTCRLGTRAGRAPCHELGHGLLAKLTEMLSGCKRCLGVLLIEVHVSRVY